MRKIVRLLVFFVEQYLFRTKRMDSCFREEGDTQFRPKQVYFIEFLFLADGVLLCTIYPGRCPGLNYSGLSGRKSTIFISPRWSSVFIDRIISIIMTSLRDWIFIYSTKSQTSAPVTFIKSSGLILNCNPR